MTRLRIGDVLDGISDADLRPLQEQARRRQFAAGTIIFREGDATDGIHLLVEGEVRITKGANGRVLAHLHDGDFFGEMGILDARPRSATAAATSDVVTMHIGKDAFLAFLRAQPLVTAQLRTAVVKRLNQNIRRALGG